MLRTPVVRHVRCRGPYRDGPNTAVNRPTPTFCRRQIYPHSSARTDAAVFAINHAWVETLRDLRVEPALPTSRLPRRR